MIVNIKTNKNFTTAFNRMNDCHGEELSRLNGFSDSQLSYTDFIENFIDKQNVADASIDGNSNVVHKDIVTLENEMSKPHSKLLVFNKIFYELNKRYGFKVANQWLEAEWDGHFYLHDAYNASMKPYCFKGDTRILTKEGIKELKELVSKDIMVLNKNHGWENATVKHFGKAILRKLTLERYGVEKELFVTGNHLWFVKNKRGTTEISTDNLKEGMKIPFNTSNVWARVNPSPFGVAHGFFIGDGDKGLHMRANFCGDKKALLPYFTPANIGGTDYELTTTGIPNSFKELPSLDESASYLYGWLSGYFSADGNVDSKGRCTISSTKRENLEFVRDVLCVLGMPVNEIRYQDRVSNLTNEMGRIYILTLTSEYLKEDFFIRPFHKENFIANMDRKNRSWVVKSVENTGIIDDVYCAVVEGTQSFTLDNNILTHNCYAYDLERLVTDGLFFITNFNSQPPQHLSTYTDFVAEFVSWTCNRSSGAVGLPSFLIYSFYFWNKDVESGHFVKSPEYYRDQSFQEIIYRLNQPYLRSGIQSAFTNFSIFDKDYLESLFGGKKFPDGSFVMSYIDDILEYQKSFMEVSSKVRSQNMMTFPVLTFALLYKDGKFVNEEFARWCCNHNMKWADSNFYVSKDVTSLSNCCRLVSDIQELGYFNSIGGTALEVGSVKVNTINLARIAYECKTKEKYLEVLKEKTILCLQTLDVIRHIIKRNIEKGLLPNYTMGIIKLESQYNTIGVIGIYEALQKYKLLKKDEFGQTFYTDEAIEFAVDILKLINDVKTEFGSDKDYKINIEEVPAERAAAVLMEKDRFFYPKQKYELPLYGNQWIPLGVSTTLSEKIRLSAILDKACSGGSIAHINIDAPFNNSETAWNMLNYVAKSGVPYFAFCTRISACSDNHGFYGDTCPECGGGKVTTYQRIVGFLTPERSYSEDRKKEFLLRDWMDIDRLQEM